MKTVAIVLAALLYSAYSFSQPNLMYQSRDAIDKEMGYKYFDGVDYSNTGQKILKYSFPMDNPDFYLDAFFFMNDKGVCDGIKYYYPNSKQLNGLVDVMTALIDDTGTYTKVENAFAWINHKRRYSVEIERLDSGGFFFIYEHLL